MLELIFKPFEFVGAVGFGASRREVIEILGPPARFDEPIGDIQLATRYWYEMPGLVTEFHVGDACDFMQIYQPSVLVLAGTRLSGSFDEVTRLLVQQGAQPMASEFCNEKPCSVDFFEFGIGIWRDDCDAPAIDSTAVWSQDFWALHPIEKQMRPWG